MLDRIVRLALLATLLAAGCTSAVKQATPPPQTSHLTIVTGSLPGGTVGSAYTGSVAASGGTAPYAYAASGLPNGLSISTSTGAITGTPAASSAGTVTATFTVGDSSQPTPQTATAKIALTVSPAKLAITTASLPGGTVGTPYSASVSATGGVAPYTFTATSLPSGLSMGSTTGEISGTPAQSDVGTTAVAIEVKDAGQPTQQTATANLSISVSAAVSGSACSKMSTGDNASLNGFVPFPASNAWNTDISSAPLDPNNTSITSAAGFAGLHLHHDFSSVAGGNYGIPYTIVDSSTTPLASISVTDYASESDAAKAPFPLTAPIEGSPADCTGWPNAYIGDSHVLVLDRNTCVLYETFNTHRCTGQWSASSETIWDMQSSEQRPWGWTSADAAGLPIFPGWFAMTK